ncbi:MAG: FGGY-family carbohydrate kinase [Proteobacteria bacterium]|nr:FGGY-family carbohydrate kinase [Pseudomonadota bacterium]
MGKTILSIDCGTQSLRALIFSTKGELLASEKILYDPYVSPQPGWAEQDPEIFWNSLVRACQGLKQKNPDLFETIHGMGITSQRATMINTDLSGKPLRSAITWLDQRKAVDKFPMKSVLYPFLKIGHLDRLVSQLYRDGKCNWIRQNQPDLWKKTHKYLQVSGFLNFRLTGEFKDSVASQIGHLPFNYKKMTWCKSLEPASVVFHVEREKLPELIPPGETIGRITRQAAELTGLCEGLPVIACGSDKGCETLGMGVLNTDMASLSFGTTATVQTTSAAYFEAIPLMPPYPAPIPGHYNPEIEIFRGYWMITWFKNEFAHKEVATAEKKGIPPELELDNLLIQSPPGAMGLVVQPYWGPGLNHPDAKGAMIGFGDVHTKAHVYRAVIEGLAYALLDGVHILEKRGKTKIKKLAVSGGASQSDQICQISADIFNRPLVRGKTTETSGLGAAILTASGTGLFDSIHDAIDAMVCYDTVFEPNPAHAETYNKLFQGVYQKIYTSLKPLYKNIRNITGYPES